MDDKDSTGTPATPPSPPPVITAKTVTPPATPEAQTMDRNAARPSFVDATRVLASITTEQMNNLRNMNMDDLAEFFERLGLVEIPGKVQEHGLNGSILHTITENDVNKMGFKSLGEGKAFQNLCVKMSGISRGEQREEVVLEKDVVFWGEIIEWHTGPCAVLNRCSFKSKRTCPEQMCDAICCSPKTLHKLPRSKILLFRDHLQITTPHWKELEDYNYDKLYASPNESPFTVMIDSIDYSNIYDVDVEQTPKLAEYKRTCADCGRVMCCQSLERDPGEGNFYWVTCWQRCMGYNRTYQERSDGIITLQLRKSDSKGNARKFGVIDGSELVAKTILNYIEESQIRKGLKVVGT